MPSLKDLNCSIELSESQQALQEFGTIYGDGFVETFVPVPSKPQPFSVHLTSSKFVAPGLAMYVFVDGVYQCNRNRQDLKLGKSSDSRSVVDFRVRQKEERQRDGSMIAREWTFEKLNSVSADDAPDLCSPNILENIGCIEVIVLRCAGTRNAKTASHMNLDGASDFPDHHFGLDGQPSATDGRSMYDDRGPFVSGFGNGYGPPPPMPSYRSPYAETVRSHEDTTSQSRCPTHTDRHPSSSSFMTRHSRPHSRYSEPISPGAPRTNNISPPGFQYGSGPVPSEGAPSQHRAPSAVVTNAPGVDPVWLDKLLTKAVKQGVEESRRHEAPPETHVGHRQQAAVIQTANQPPGAWPTSPFGPIAQPYQRSEPSQVATHNDDEARGTAWDQSQGGWGQIPARSRAGTRVTWNAEPVWEKESNAEGWNSHEETPSDSWDTDETWTTKKPERWEATGRQGRARAPTAPSHFGSRLASPIAVHAREPRRSKDSRSRKTLSRSRPTRSRRDEGYRSSSEDNEGWTHIEAASDSLTSWEKSDDTIQPSHSRSQVHTPQSASMRSSRHSKYAHSDHKRSESRHRHPIPTWQPADIRNVPAPSVVTRVTPTVMNAPPSVHPSGVPSRKVSMYSEPPVPVAPPPTWGCAVTEKGRKNSNATSYLPPAPYAQSMNGAVRSTASDNHVDSRSTSSSSWGSGNKSSGAKGSWGDSPKEKPDWNNNNHNGWEKIETGEQAANGWEATNDNQNTAWEVADDVKDVQASAWEINNNDWKVDDSPKEQKDDVVAADIWGTNKDDWTAEDTSKEQNNNIAATDAWDTNRNNWNTNKNDWDTTKDAETPWANQVNISNNPSPNDTHNAIEFKTDNLWAPAPASTKPTKAPSTSRRHTSKSLSKYRQLRSASAELAPKPHWQFPPPSSHKKLLPIHEDHGTYIAPKEPLYKISKQVASEKGVEHQVRAGKGIQYGHVVGRPEYLDHLDKPYAVFRFKYRSRTILKNMFGDKVPDHGQVTQPPLSSSLAKSKQKEKEKLKYLPQDQLIEKMLTLQTKLAQKESRRESKAKELRRRPSGSLQTEVVARNLTEDWVKQHSRDPSEKGKSGEVKAVGKEKEKEKEEVKDAWGQNAGVEGDWANVKW